MLWFAAVIGFCHFGFYGMFGRFFGRGAGTVFLGISWSLGLVATGIMGSLFAWVASRFFIEARHTGELELLLTTPLGAQQIVSAQWDFLKRLVRLPVLVMLVPVVFQGLIMLSLGYRPSGLWRLHYALSLFLSAANTVLSVGALCWLALWFGLRVIGQARAIFWTVLLADGLPWALSLGWSLLYRSLLTGVGSPVNSWPGWPLLLAPLAPQLASLLFYVWLIRVARWQLLEELAGAEPFDLPQILSRALPRITAAIHRARRWPAV
jgi:hypothetical protein